MYRLYQMQDSGNCYKLRLLMAQLRVPCEIVHIDILKGESRTPSFLEKNPNGRVPTLEIDEGTWLPESNAALWYLAQGSAFLPEGRLPQAQALQWMFFEQYSHEPYIATSRYWISILGQPEQYRRQLDERRPGGIAALEVMNRHLAANDFFVGQRYSIADIALYAYTHVAHEGGFDLAAYDAINRWIGRVADQPGHIGMSDPYPDFP